MLLCSIVTPRLATEKATKTTVGIWWCTCSAQGLLFSRITSDSVQEALWDAKIEPGSAVLKSMSHQGHFPG